MITRRDLLKTAAAAGCALSAPALLAANAAAPVAGKEYIIVRIIFTIGSIGPSRRERAQNIIPE